MEGGIIAVCVVIYRCMPSESANSNVLQVFHQTHVFEDSLVTDPLYFVI